MSLRSKYAARFRARESREIFSHVFDFRVVAEQLEGLFERVQNTKARIGVVVCNE